MEKRGKWPGLFLFEEVGNFEKCCLTNPCLFIIREVNSDMPIYILTEQMSEKIKCPERDSNPRHPDLMEGALTTERPRQPLRVCSHQRLYRAILRVLSTNHGFQLTKLFEESFEHTFNQVFRNFDTFGGKAAIA